ncbi:hypothetical protein NE237_026892 [Protea cynaroides]|uniref:Pectinesterase n=1 Tax=Protea cynaroides TaxID=273540 RepID=A0A9Q0JTP8_9MAGN|nr:hypothetical protein NE237_026892 [Protea cynaroides]
MGFDRTIIGEKCSNEKEKAAWSDCMVLYHDTVLQLNTTVDPDNNYTDFDKQTWLSTTLTNLDTCDRKLLQAKSKFGKPDLAVAKDGSGNYPTIQAALDAASKAKNGSNRFVIYAKKGVYDENLDINLKNITLLGDGLRFTIITGNRSVARGFTTFRSATVGK